MPHPFAEGLEVSHVASVPGGLDHNQPSGMASLGKAFRHDVAYKAPPYCLQLPPGSQYFIMIFPYFQSCHCRSLTNKSRVDHPTSDPAMQKRQQQCFGSAHRSCDTSTEIRVESCESLKRDVEDHEIVNNRNQIYMCSMLQES